MRTLKKYWRIGGICCLASIMILAALKALADVPQPVLNISSLGNNEFSIVLTNGVATTNYTLFWTPALENPLYPWQVVHVGAVGETNFTIVSNVWSVGFFRVTIGSDADGDGSPDWQDAQPINPNVGTLSITIDSPTGGSTFN